MKGSQKQQCFLNYLASNGGKMNKVKLMTNLFNSGVLTGENDFNKVLASLNKNGYIALDGDDVIFKKAKRATPSMEDIYINDSSKVKDDVTLTPNAMTTSNPAILP